MQAPLALIGFLSPFPVSSLGCYALLEAYLVAGRVQVGAVLITYHWYPLEEECLHFEVLQAHLK